MRTVSTAEEGKSEGRTEEEGEVSPTENPPNERSETKASYRGCWRQATNDTSRACSCFAARHRAPQA